MGRQSAAAQGKVFAEGDLSFQPGGELLIGLSALLPKGGLWRGEVEGGAEQGCGEERLSGQAD